ncbi:MAG: DUF4468 domain-containing protein [Sphingobacteriales bacterium]|nr:MAG: DUF4468 domain-containing protein [Sphingobacteriales bacterium]
MKMLKISLLRFGLLTLTFICFLSTSYRAMAQQLFPEDPQTGLFTHSKVIFIDSTSKDELFLRGKTWFTTHPDMQQAEIKSEDAAGGIISSLATKTITLSESGKDVEVPVHFLVNIYVKGSRCKYEFTEVTLDIDGKTGVKAENYFKGNKLSGLEKQALSKTKRAILSIEKSLIGAMTNNDEEAIVRRYKSE